MHPATYIHKTSQIYLHTLSPTITHIKQSHTVSHIHSCTSTHNHTHTKTYSAHTYLYVWYTLYIHSLYMYIYIIYVEALYSVNHCEGSRCGVGDEQARAGGPQTCELSPAPEKWTSSSYTCRPTGARLGWAAPQSADPSRSFLWDGPVPLPRTIFLSLEGLLGRGGTSHTKYLHALPLPFSVLGTQKPSFFNSVEEFEMFERTI